MQSRIALRTFLICALLLVLLPIIMASGWFFYRSAFQATEQFAQQLAAEVSGRIREKVIAFFDVPQRVVAFNVEQARAGYLLHDSSDELMQQFLLQIRQQPQLSFVSMGTVAGEYFAGSRSPIGAEKDLRMLQARIVHGRAMEVFQVDTANNRANLISRSDIHFDARVRPWFKAAVESGTLSWYAPYRYFINDVQGAYASMGMGVSAPLFDGTGAFIGVVTADVALSQLSDFLRTMTAASGGVAFLADADGELLAASTQEPSFHLDAKEPNYRVKTTLSENPVLRAAGLAMAVTGQADGNSFIEVNNTRHLVHWWRHHLARGPELTIGVILPESQFNTPLRGVLRNIVYLTLAVMLASILFAVFVTNRVVRPLATLSDWGARLTTGDWSASAPKSSPIRELSSLSDAMGYMAGHLKQHAQNLEQLVAQRTAELERAMGVIEQALTDQRQFIAMLSHEVRSPLAVIDTAAQLLSFRLKNDPTQLAVAERILRGSARLNIFFDNCLTQDRIDSENFALQPSPIDVSSMVSWVIESCVQFSNDHALETELAPDLPPLYGDEVLLRILLINLLSNAIKYSPSGTAVTLRVWRDNTLCCFSVEDCGTVIPAEEVAVIFQKYRRGRTAEGKPGAGLGLALVARIATLHGGTVRVENREVKGTRFILAIPFNHP
jgi:signal transduction histidine kinase